MSGMNRDENARPQNEPRVERPRYEPEIIPPAHERRNSQQSENVFIFTDRQGRTRRVTQPRPLTVFLVLALFVLISSIILALLLGALLLWIPVAATIIVVMLGAAYVRSAWRRLRGRPPNA
jgi:cation transport ATPase